MLIVQIAFAWRLWVVSLKSNYWLPIVTALLATMSWGNLTSFHECIFDDSDPLAIAMWYVWFFSTHPMIDDFYRARFVSLLVCVLFTVLT